MGRQEGRSLLARACISTQDVAEWPRPRREKRNKRQFWCQADWSQLAKVQGGHPRDEPMKEWVDRTKGTFGDDCEGRPDIGCKSKFLPRKSGALMSVEPK
eukprot:346156-Pyramimonas_sp.AAC.1